MNIRLAGKTDEEIITKLYYDLNYEIKSKKRIKFKDFSYKPIVLLAEEKGVVAGFVSASFINSFDLKQAYIDELFVSKDFRGKGVAENLLKNLLKRLKTLKTEVIFVTTGKTNKKAINLYKKIGFKKTNNPWFYLEPK